MSKKSAQLVGGSDQFIAEPSLSARINRILCKVNIGEEPDASDREAVRLAFAQAQKPISTQATRVFVAVALVEDAIAAIRVTDNVQDADHPMRISAIGNFRRMYERLSDDGRDIVNNLLTVEEFTEFIADDEEE